MDYDFCREADLFNKTLKIKPVGKLTNESLSLYDVTKTCTARYMNSVASDGRQNILSNSIGLIFNRGFNFEVQR